MSYLFSIVTPCFRGSDFLPRTFASLLVQKGNYPFEWIIVDDFSNDEGKTKSVIQRIEKESPFPVKTIYLDKNHYGSLSAYTGAINAKGSYIIILDQDDMLTDDALEIFADGIIRHENVANFAGVCGRCINLDGKLIGQPFPWPEKLTNELHVRHIYKIRGEMFQCTKKQLIIEYFKGMKPGYTNGWAWNRIARQYDYLYTSKLVRIYDTVNPSSTSNMKRMIYLDAQFESLSQYLSDNFDFLKNDPIFAARLLLQWTRVGIHVKKPINELLLGHLGKKYRQMILPIIPVAYIKVIRDRLIGNV